METKGTEMEGNEGERDREPIILGPFSPSNMHECGVNVWHSIVSCLAVLFSATVPRVRQCNEKV